MGSNAGVDARLDFVNFDRLYQRLNDRLVEATRSALDDAGEAVRQRLEELSPEATGDFKSSWEVYSVARRGRIGEEVKVVNTSRHAAYTEYGREPGKAPPYTVIRDWAYDRGLISVLPEDPGNDGREVKRRAAPLKAGVVVSAGRRRAARAHPAARPVSTRPSRATIQGADADAKARGLVFGIMRKIADEGVPGANLLSRHAEELRKIALAVIQRRLFEDLGETF